MPAIRHNLRWIQGLVAFALLFLCSSILGAQELSAELENELLAVLKSDAPSADKALVCKKLAIDGSSQSVPALANLLPDPQLSSWARIALEAIPGSESDAALREAASTIQGRQLIGVLNSIGVRRDVNAVDVLTERLRDPDVQVAAAAAVALGRIGNAAATQTLRNSLTAEPMQLRSAIAEGCVRCAESALAANQDALAIELYDQIRQADIPLQRRIEATRGAILARHQQGIPLLMDTLRSPELKFFQIALATARELPGDQLHPLLAEELKRATPERAALIVQVMADRSNSDSLASILEAATEGVPVVRHAAIEALRRVGDESCLPVLLRLAGDSNPDLALAARETLAELPGENVNPRIIALLPKAAGAEYTRLLELIGQRRIDAVTEVLPALDHSDPNVRHAALMALGETVPLNRLGLLIDPVVKANHREDAAVALLALKTASIRMPDREACAARLTGALDAASPETRSALLEILGEVGGSTSLKALATAAKSQDAALQDTGSRLLGKWNGVDAAPVLLDLAKTAPAEKYQVRALRGYLGLARKFSMPEAARVEMCRQAMEIAVRNEERKLALDVLQIHPSPEALQLAISARQIVDLRDDATAATMIVAQKLGAEGVDIKALLKSVELDEVELEVTKAQYGAGAVQRDVTELVRKQAGRLPLISLAAANYNASLGGDPAPGLAKQLTIEYRINGKPGRATFAENALILLPAPR